MAWHDGEKLRDHPEVEGYLADLGDPQRGICLEARAIVKEDPDVLEFIAWGVPCYWRKGPLCYTSAAKSHVTLGFFRGIEIGDGLVGTGKSPIAKVAAKRELPAEYRAWVAEALRLDDQGE